MKRAELISELMRDFGIPQSQIKTAVEAAGLKWPEPGDELTMADADSIRAVVTKHLQRQNAAPPETSPQPPNHLAQVQEAPAAPPTNSHPRDGVIDWDQIARTCGSKREGIGIIGLAGSGKTAYMYVIGRDYMRLSLGGWRVGTRTDDYKRFIIEHDGKLDNWPPTNPNVPPKVIELFTLVRDRKGVEEKLGVERRDATHATIVATCAKNAARIFRNLGKRIFETDIVVHSFDVAGELIRAVFTGTYDGTIHRYDANDVRTLCQAICRAEGFLVILDSEIAARPDKAEHLQNEQVQWDFIFERLRKLDSGPAGQHIDRPVAVVLNKADYFVFANQQSHNGDLLGIALPLQARRSLDANEYELQRRKTADDRYTRAREFVRQRYPMIYNYVEKVSGERILKHVWFVGISCWGKHPSPANRPGRDIYPTLIEEPLEWLANQILARRIAALKKKIRRTAMALAAACAALVLSFSLLFNWTSAIAYDYALKGTTSTAFTLTQRNPIRRVARMLGITACERRVVRVWIALFSAHAVSFEDLERRINESGVSRADTDQLLSSMLLDMARIQAGHDIAAALQSLGRAMDLSTKRDIITNQAMRILTSVASESYRNKKTDTARDALRALCDYITAEACAALPTPDRNELISLAAYALRGGHLNEAAALTHSLARAKLPVLLRQRIFEIWRAHINDAPVEDAEGLLDMFPNDVIPQRELNHLRCDILIRYARILAGRDNYADAMLKLQRALMFSADTADTSNTAARVLLQRLPVVSRKEALQECLAAAAAFASPAENAMTIVSAALNRYRRANPDGGQAALHVGEPYLIHVSSRQFEEVCELISHALNAGHVREAELLSSTTIRIVHGSSARVSEIWRHAINSSPAQRASMLLSHLPTGLITAHERNQLRADVAVRKAIEDCAFQPEESRQLLHDAVRLASDPAQVSNVAVKAFLDAAQQKSDPVQIHQYMSLALQFAGPAERARYANKAVQTCKAALARSLAARHYETSVALTQLALQWDDSDAAKQTLKPVWKDQVRRAIVYDKVDLVECIPDDIVTGRERGELMVEVVLSVEPGTPLDDIEIAIRQAEDLSPHSAEPISNKAVLIFVDAASYHLQNGSFHLARRALSKAHRYVTPHNVHRVAPRAETLVKSIVLQALRNGDPQAALDTITETQVWRFDAPVFETLRMHAEKARSMVYIKPANGTAPFYLDKYEVSNEEYERWQPGHTRRFTNYNKYSPQPDCPVIFVSYDDAAGYARWAGKRLPTLDEWNAAAQHVLARRHSLRICSRESYYGSTTRVRGNDFPDDTTAQGVRHMLGNVAEWVSAPQGPQVRGTSWLDSKENITRSPTADYRERETGFRCALDCVPTNL